MTGHGIYDHHGNPLDAIKTTMTSYHLLCDAYVMKPLEQTRLLELSPVTRFCGVANFFTEAIDA